MMPTIQDGDIVVAADGSSHADRAVRWAAEQAAFERRRLVVVTVDEDGAERANEDALRLARDVAPSIDVVGLTAPGDPRVTLVELSQHAHLLVMGSRGRGTIRSLLLGSVGAAVARLSFCPVVVCRGSDTGHAGRGVLVGVDGTPESLAVLGFAFEQASLRGQDLTVVHCVWDVAAAVAGLRSEGIRDIGIDDADLGTIDDGQLVVAESVAGFSEKYPDVAVSRRVTHGLVDDVLGGHTDAWDLVVVGRHPSDTLDRLVAGSIATAVLERAHTAVAVVPSPRMQPSPPA